MTRHGAKNRNSEKDWRERVAVQERSGLSGKQFCEQQQITEQRFYVWRKRLREREPVRFAVMETGPGQRPAAEAGLELVLAKGERLRIGAGVDGALLRTVPGGVARMIHLPPSVRVYLCLSACDMRKSFDSLHALVRGYLELDAYAGHLVVFASRRREKNIVELKELQHERLTKREADLTAAAHMYERFKKNGDPFDPAEFGFFFSIDEIERRVGLWEGHCIHCQYPEQFALIRAKQLREERQAA